MTDRLEDGRSTDTPDGDNALLDHARGDAEAYRAVAVASGAAQEDVDDLGLTMTDAGLPTPYGNISYLTRPVDPARTDELAGALRDFYGARTGGPGFVFSPWPVDLSAAGFVLGGHPPLMVRPSLPHVSAESDLVIEEASGPEQLAVFEDVLIDGYPVHEMQPFGSQPRLLTDPLLASAWRFYVGSFEGEPVTCAAVYVTPHLGLIEMVATRQPFRGRGYGGAVTAVAMLAAPDRPAALVASDPGRHVYEQLGFVAVTRYSLWIVPR